MTTVEDDAPGFLCDAMLGGLARWLRAAGYDAEFEAKLDDARLVARAEQTGATLLSSDSGVFERNVIRDGSVTALFVPRGLDKKGQLVYVMRQLKLAVRDMPRCMSCGGRLLDLDKAAIRDEAPPRAYAACDRFWRCARCGKLFWQGTHWPKIFARLADAAGQAK